ncbi:glycoside hydrolase family 16 protein [Kiritimatiellaeota bacterium B1221]|nr:glycoside hydrolase family 16 protein [Kiritimatiellaeota bacterium B1221]
MQNKTQMDPERAVANDQGELVLTVEQGFPAKGGSTQSKKEYGFGRWVGRVRPSHVPGVLNSIFTKDWDDMSKPEREDDGKMGEVDFEFLTYTFGEGKGEVHIGIHLLDKSNLWSREILLDFNPADDFHEWGFDILPDRVVWHVDGKHIFTWLYDDENKIDPMYQFFFNAWSMEKWIKGPAAADAHYHIDWVKFYPLLTD